MNSLLEPKRFFVATFYYQFPGSPEDAYEMTNAGARLDTPGVGKLDPLYIQSLWVNRMV